MSLMKKLPLLLFSTALMLSMVACTEPSPPVVVETATSTLNVTLTGTTTAPVKVVNAVGEVKFDGAVTTSKSLGELPRGKYTVTGGAVSNLIAPAPQTADLSAGNGAVTLNYLASPVGATADLTVTLTGVPMAPVKVTDAGGTVTFDGSVTGSKTLNTLPRGKYTVTGGAVANFASPATQTADLSAGNGSATLNYLALAGNTVVSTTVSGVIPSWKLGKTNAALAHVYILNGTYYSYEDVVSPPGTIAADGTLSISLPNTLNDSYLHTYEIIPAINDTVCAFTGAVTDRELKTDWYSRSLVQAADSPLGYVQEYLNDSSASSRHFVSRVYSAADSIIKGTVYCRATPYSEAFNGVYDLILNRGWNSVETYADNDGTFHAVTLAAGARSSLLFQSFAPEVRVVLNNSSLQLKRGERVTIGATVTQIGGYSGTVAVGTNVPGVTVEPSTLTLNPVTTQSVKTQALHSPQFLHQQELTQSVNAASISTQLTFVASADAAEHGYLSTDQLQLTDASGAVLATAPINVNVVVPSVTGYLNYGSGVLLDRGQTVSLPVNLYSYNGYSGPVTVSLENLPEGVSATTVQTTLGAIMTPNISITASATAVTGLKEAQLVVNAGGQITRSKVSVTVQKPSVLVNFGSYNLTVRRGQSQNLTVQVSSEHGFSGSTTVSLSGLPSGVTSAPLTVNVTPGTITSAALALTASDTAVYGSTTVQLTGDDLSITSQPQLTLIVASTITAVPSEAVRIATAGNGLWTLGTYGRSASAGNFYGYDYAVKRYEGKQLKVDMTLFVEGGTNSVPLTTPSGDLVIFGGLKTYVIKADGTSSSVIGDTGTSYYAKVIDSQNRLWYANLNSGNGVTLSTLNLSTGARAPVSNIAVSDTYFRMFRNASGSTLYFLSGSIYSANSTLTQIDVATTKTKDIALPGVTSVGSLVIKQDGSIWGGGSYSGIFKVNDDGTLTIFSSLPTVSRLVLDAADSKYLWGTSGSTLYKIDTVLGTSTSIPVGASTTDIAADNGGGVWAVGDEYNYSSGSTTYFLSLVK
jgi:trimeric autotransporter adhesin